MEHSEAMIAAIRSEFPKFRMIEKRGDPLSALIDRLLRILTLGRQNRYLTDYHTVLGNTLYLPLSWERMADVDRAILLRHERVHLRQRRRLGMPLMAFLYLVPIFPVFLALGRARLEWEAYVETLRATAELRGESAARSPGLRAHIIERFVGPDYGWMWPFRGQLEKWYDAALASLAGAPPGS